MSRILGIDPLTFYSAEDLLHGLAPAVGTRGMDALGNEYIMCSLASATGNPGVVWHINAAYLATAVVNGATVLFGRRVGVTPGTTALGSQSGWLMVNGNTGVRANAAAAINVILRTTAVPGDLDDVAAGATAYPVNGIVFTTAPNAQGTFPAQVLNPFLGALNT